MMNASTPTCQTMRRAVEAHEPLLLQRGQQPVRGRGRQADDLGDIGQRHAVATLGQRAQQRQRAGQGLHLTSPAIVGGGREPLAGNARHAGSAACQERSSMVTTSR